MSAEAIAEVERLAALVDTFGRPGGLVRVAAALGEVA